jgi:glutamate/tyrosine decarboxylase-like PLP-dependent enzyme
MDKNLSWFIGPKAENAKYFSELLELITQDYFHWRKNYFPEDSLLINKSDQRDFNQDNDILNQNINEFLASLRRNFPFYNPRYIAHMLSDTTMAGMLGYFGAMLYNPNNVTPESAPVTTEWEIEVCNSIIKMLGYRPSPKPPSKDASITDWKRYEKELGNEFGWSHITSGGTVANIEALWVARTIKYYPLAIQEVSINNGLNIAIKLPSYSEHRIDENIKDIKTISKFDLINIKPNGSIYLLSRFIQAYSEKFSNLSLESSTKQAIKELNEAEYSLSNSLGKLLTEFPIAIFVSGAAHYSVRKAADILGIGVNNIILIPMDSQFRADIKQLEILMKECLSKKISPLAVIGIAGTTEEGAIDPIDEIVELRNKFEKELCVSFWLHIDAAWGGFIKTIIELSPEEEYRINCQRAMP